MPTSAAMIATGSATVTAASGRGQSGEPSVITGF